VVTLVIAIGLSASVTLTRDFSVGRIVMLMPFFAAGLVLTPDHLKRLAGWRLQSLAVVVLLAAVPIAAVIAQELRRSAVLWTGQGNGQGFTGVVVQTGLYAVAAVMIAAFLCLTPRGNFRWTPRGSKSLYVYLLHLLPILLIRQALDDSTLPLAALVALAAAASVALSFVLSSHVVTRLTRPLVEPRVPWLFARPGAARPLGQ
jgi:fucose 4-O-acetylase-like acetyltransferase